MCVDQRVTQLQSRLIHTECATLETQKATGKQSNQRGNIGKWFFADERFVSLTLIRNSQQHG